MSEREREFARWLANTPGTITASLLTWITVHGNLCLALRHPQNRGPSRKLAVEFVKALGKALVEWKALTPEQLKEAEKLEAEEEATNLRKFKATVRMRKAWTAVFPKKPTVDMVLEALADEILRGEIDELFEVELE